MFNTLPANFLSKINSGDASQIVIGNENSSSIPDGSSGFIFQITNNQGSDILVTSLIFGFDITYSRLVIEVKNTQKNKFLISGNCQLINLGIPNSTKSAPADFEIIPFVLSSGQYIEVYASNTLGIAVPAKSISLTIKGIQ